MYPCILSNNHVIKLRYNSSIIICNSKEDIEILLTLYHKEYDESIRNISINEEKNEIDYEVIQDWLINYNDEEDWLRHKINYEILITINDYNNKK